VQLVEWFGGQHVRLELRVNATAEERVSEIYPRRLSEYLILLAALNNAHLSCRRKMKDPKIRWRLDLLRASIFHHA